MNCRALLIEDELVSGYSLYRQLLHFKIGTIQVGTILEAIQILHDNEINIIFLDLLLPAPDGFLFLKIRSETEKFRQIPVIVLSGKADIETISLALKCGANGYLIKPFQEALLVQALNDCGVFVTGCPT